MSFDCSRFTFNAWNDFLGVVMQQGRVQLDADWNELVSQLIRRTQAGTLDTFERTVVPRVTPDGFRIQAVGGKLTIGTGRIYVDGILAENHGKGARKWDPRLAEEVGSELWEYSNQPYFKEPPTLPVGGTHLIYLDVWQRELTYLQAPELVEKAVGVDTTARLQTVWQVKVLPSIGNAQCSTPDAEVSGWADTIRPSAGRLSTKEGGVGAAPDPCLIPPSGGYRGRENQLYRVEIHRAGVANDATFKWSRDNGSVQTRVTNINAARDRIVVDDIGRDSVLRFSDGDWIEITDDVRELGGEPGIMVQIKLGGGVIDATRSISLATPLPNGAFPTDAQGGTAADRNTRVRRWDQSAKVLREDGSEYVDLDATNQGVIKVPPAGTWLLLEDGVLVNFQLAEAGGKFHVGDHWCFAARTASATVERLSKAPPLGIHHHYARLAVVTLPDMETDCRVLWPPAPSVGEQCACDVCVTEAGHASGSATIQQAIDKLAKTGGVICLGTGIYRLRESLRLEGARSVTLRGKGLATVLIPEVAGTAIQIQQGIDIKLEQFAVAGAAGQADRPALIEASNTVQLTLDRLYLLALSADKTSSAALQLRGYSLGTRIRECALVADVGVIGGASDKDLLLTGQLVIEDNLLLCARRGISLGNRCLHYAEVDIARNLILNSQEAGVLALGGGLPASSVRIRENSVYGNGDGVVAGVDNLRIVDNQVRGNAANRTGSGIVLARGLAPAGIGHLWIMGNHVVDLPGAAIEVRVPLGCAQINQNILEATREGISFVEGGASAQLSIENNQLLRIAEGYNPAAASVVAIQVLSAEDVDIVGNVVRGAAQSALQASSRAGIRVVASGNVRIAGNHLSEIGPSGEHSGYSAAIELQYPFTSAIISENLISRSSSPELKSALWHAIRVAPLERNFSLNLGALVLDVGYMLSATKLVAFVARDPRNLAIRGNQASARAIGRRLVVAARAETCSLLDNQLEGAVAGADLQRGALVELNAHVVIASSNRLRWLDDDHDALDILKARAFTVMGNVTMGRIRIDTANDLPPPWQALNIQA